MFKKVPIQIVFLFQYVYPSDHKILVQTLFNQQCWVVCLIFFFNNNVYLAYKIADPIKRMFCYMWMEHG